FYARRTEDFDKPFKITLENPAGTVYADASIIVDSTGWKKYTARLTASGSTVTGRLVVVTSGTDTVNLDMVSLYPEDTFMGLPIRADIARMIADLKPAFFRFPGGCIVHAGSYREDAPYRVYRWKDTIGDPAQRPESASMWAANHQSFGLGFYEYFLFAEAIGATPIPHVTAGIDPHEVPGERGAWYVVPLRQMQEWIDNALDLIEFANGDVTTKWGAIRAELGHPEPFNLKYIGIGNEDIGSDYSQRFVLFQKAIKEKYPDIQVISSSGPWSQGWEFDYGWQFSKEAGADVVDEHFYNDPNWFLENWRRYDSYDRSGPKVFIGEYASKGNTFYNALAEAAFMTGIERNGDVVAMASYAPLLANVDYLNWTPDLIWFNNHQVYGTPNYYVQQMFSHNKGDVVIPSTFTGTVGELAEPEPIRGAIGLSTWNTQAKFTDVKVIDNETGAVLFSDDFADASQWQAKGGNWCIADGWYVQKGSGTDLRAYVGDEDWSNYTLTLKAAKLSGAEGFLIMFGRRDDHNYYWWNIGGWNNTQHAIEKAVNSSRGPVISRGDTPIQIGREYDIKIVMEGRRIRCYLDGRLVHDYYDGPKQVEPLYYVTSKDLETGDLILKAVNTLGSPMETRIVVDGVEQVEPEAAVICLTADKLDAVNSFQKPDNVTTATKQITGVSTDFAYTFPSYS
ncbi:MAG TPA: alpha-L-arabinofuranosidase C-terminal domain-containing protein, partial [Limnochordia bacterium]|nr:alpha-L-arabinofuranosidase C-terminal domain-containing protein [Limnochordia bacterium]